MTYLQAKSENILTYKEYSLKIERVDKLLQLLTRADSLSQEAFIKYMKFENEISFLDWISQLPSNSPIKLNNFIPFYIFNFWNI